MAKKNAVIDFPYEIEHRGKMIRCRTLSDMQVALQQLENSRTSKDLTPWSDEEFQKFTGRIHWQQRRLLATLMEYTTALLEDVKLEELLALSPVEDIELRKRLKIPTNQSLAGVLSGISKVALMFGIEPRRVYTQSTRYRHGKAHRYYSVTSEFLRVAAKHQWPSKDDLKEPKPERIHD